MPSMHEILTRAFSEQNDDEPSLPTFESQLHELDVIKKEMDGRGNPSFKRWDRVEYIHRCGQIKEGMRKQIPLVYWSHLDPTSEIGKAHIEYASKEIMAIPNPNCLLACLSPGVGLIVMIGDTDLLRRCGS